MTGPPRLGLLGGTFDPPHFGHLVAAQEAAERLSLQRVLFLPAAQPPHKQGELVSPLEVRLRMVELAIAGDPCFSLSLADTGHSGPSYTADLLAKTRSEVGPAAELFFLVGMDSLHDLTTWQEPGRVLVQCTLVAVSRPGCPAVDLAGLEAQLPGAAARILILDTPGVDVSSSELRLRAATGRPIRYLVPDSVREFIESSRLYTATD